jgi:uncharacterized membrane protein YgdD (TMEM256/DUF423 family)
MARIFCILGALSAFIGVAAGAFGAHVLKGRLDPGMQSVFETAVRYQLVHALALVMTAWVQTRWSASVVIVGGWFFVIGTVLFSGSLYVLSMSGFRWFGAITPFGGFAFLAGWACVAWGVWKGSAN